MVLLFECPVFSSSGGNLSTGFNQDFYLFGNQMQFEYQTENVCLRVSCSSFMNGLTYHVTLSSPVLGHHLNTKPYTNCTGINHLNTDLPGIQIPTVLKNDSQEKCVRRKRLIRWRHNMPSKCHHDLQCPKQQNDKNKLWKYQNIFLLSIY